jgi:hypothetical protein
MALSRTLEGSMVEHLREDLLHTATISVEDSGEDHLEGQSALWAVAYHPAGQRAMEERAHLGEGKLRQAVLATPIGGIAHDPLFGMKDKPAECNRIPPNMQIVVDTLHGSDAVVSGAKCKTKDHSPDEGAKQRQSRPTGRSPFGL